MGEEECLPLIAAGGRPPPSNALEILWGASKLLGRAWKLMLPVLFIYLIPSSFLFLAAYVGTMPWIVDMVRALFAMKTKGSSNLECLALLPQLIEDLREFAAVGVGMMLASFLLSSFITTAVINALAKASKVEKTDRAQGVAVSETEEGRYGLTKQRIIVAGSLLPSVLVGVFSVAVDMAFCFECRNAMEKVLVSASL